MNINKKELLEMFAEFMEHDPMMRIELKETLFGVNIQGGFNQEELDRFEEEHGVSGEEIVKLYNKHLKEAVQLFAEEFHKLLKKSGLNTTAVDLNKED